MELSRGNVDSWHGDGTKAGEGKLGYVCATTITKGTLILVGFQALLSAYSSGCPQWSRCLGLPPGQRKGAGVWSWARKGTHTILRAGSSSKTPGCRLEKMFPDMFLQGAGNSETGS